MNYLDFEALEQKSLSEAIDRLEHFFQLSIIAEDSNLVEETLVFYAQCRRWSLIAALLAVGVNAKKYADN